MSVSLSALHIPFTGSIKMFCLEDTESFENWGDHSPTHERARSNGRATEASLSLNFHEKHMPSVSTG